MKKSWKTKQLFFKLKKILPGQRHSLHWVWLVLLYMLSSEVHFFCRQFLVVQETWFFKKKLSPKKSFPAPQIMENESYVALLSILASVLIKEDVFYNAERCQLYITKKDNSCLKSKSLLKWCTCSLNRCNLNITTPKTVCLYVQLTVPPPSISLSIKIKYM